MKGIRTKTDKPVLVQDMEKLVKKIQKVLNKSCSMDIETWQYNDDRAKTSYRLYVEGTGFTKPFNTWPELVKYIEKEVI